MDYSKEIGNADFPDILHNYIYDKLLDRPLDELNHTQKVLVLCVLLEDACQADTILNLIEDGHAPSLSDIVSAHYEIGAPITAGLVQKFVEILPESVLSCNADYETIDKIFHDKRFYDIDSQICSYPDGSMREKYIRYAKLYSEDIFS